MAPIKDGNYMIRLDIRDANGSNQLNPQSQLNDPPAFGIQKMRNITDSNGTCDVAGACRPIRERLNPMNRGKDYGDSFHGQSNGHRYKHGWLCDGTDTRFADCMWNNMPHLHLPPAVDTPVQQP